MAEKDKALDLFSYIQAQTKLPIYGSAPSASTLPPGKLAVVDDGTSKRLYFNFNGTLAYIDFTEA